MSDAVERFSPFAVDGGCDAYGDMEDDTQGDWVRYEDYEALTARAEAAGKTCSEWAEISQANYRRAKAAEARERALRDTTDELRELRAQYNLVVGDNIRLRGVVDSMKSSRSEIESETLERAANVCKYNSAEWDSVSRSHKLMKWSLNIGCAHVGHAYETAIRAMIEEKTDE